MINIFPLFIIIMFWYSIISHPSFSIDENIIYNIFQTISQKIDIPQNGILNIVFVSPLEIQNLNNTYRQKNSVTDVLSFHYYDDFSYIDSNEIAGEIILCEEKILSQAKEFWLGNQKEFYKLLIHSILHILGYDHEEDNEFKIMDTQEKLIWKEIFEKY